MPRRRTQFPKELWRQIWSKSPQSLEREGSGFGFGFGAHPAAQDDRIASAGGKTVGQPLDVVGPLGENQAVPAPFTALPRRRR
jgi:hypothetical protein